MAGGGNKRKKSFQKGNKKNKVDVFEQDAVDPSSSSDQTLKKSRPNVWGPQTIGNDLLSKQGSPQWKELIAKNDWFEKYYKKMNIIQDEQEFKLFLDTLGKPLPTTFRINTAIGESLSNIVKQQLKSIVDNLVAKTKGDDPTTMMINGESYAVPTPLSWYPGENLAWHTSLAKSAFRKNETLADFHQFLMHHDNQGNLTRQEAVSMIPPLFLDVQPHHMVLDMCAAPGSKTTQIIEALHAHHNIKKDASIPEGLIIANDADQKRCYMLVHQTDRLGSPCIMITNHEAQKFPKLQLENPDGSKTPFLLDRILADVPCSGDGTLRKNPDLWRRWTPGGGAALHKLQTQIAFRAANLLKVGGRMVYSTCSINPLENEAVINDLIQRCKGSMRVVDVSSQYPTLIRAKGLLTWSVYDKDEPDVYYDTYDQVPESKKMTRLYPSYFAPTTQEEALQNGLQHCMRVYPHMQDTGGFFITVIEKISDLPKFTSITNQNNQDDEKVEKDEKELNNTTNVTTTTTTNNNNNNNNRRGGKDKNTVHQFFEEPFTLVSEDTLPSLDMVDKFFGFDNKFPMDHLLTRSNKSKILYLASSPIMSIVKGDKDRRLRIINAGLEVFKRHEGLGSAVCPYRISQMSVQWIRPYMNKRVLDMNYQDLVNIVRNTEPLFTSFTKEMEQTLDALEPGCFLVRVSSSSNDTNQSGVVAHTDGMLFSVWRGKCSIHLLVQKQDIQSLANMLHINIEKIKGQPLNQQQPNNKDDEKEEEVKKDNDSVESKNE